VITNSTDFIGAGWSYPMEINVNGEFALAKGTHKIEQAMHLILGTYPGERPMRPEFGSRLRDFVFQPSTLDNAADVGREVTRSLERWEPRVTIKQVDVVPDPVDVGLLHIDIHYLVKATNDERNLVFPFYTIPETEGV
jgi:phage baseplate assembly protein W